MTATKPWLAYDHIGIGYARRRRPDARIAAQILRALENAETIINVGAGAGSYEPVERQIIGVEPAMAMIRQRGPTAAPVVQGCAEALPFATGTFDASLALLTIHHWSNWRAGLREMVRVARQYIVLFTWDPASEGFWARDYWPEFWEHDRKIFPPLPAIQEVTGAAKVIPVPIPHDCVDGFMGAYWRRPAAYLVPDVRQAISSFAAVDTSAGLARLATDLRDGTWEGKHANLLNLEEIDLGYRLLVVGCASS